MLIANGLIIDKKWIDLIIRGEKQWEMRSKATRFRGWFALAHQRKIYGVAYLRDCGEKYNKEQIYQTYHHHRIPHSIVNKDNFKAFIPWQLAEVRKFNPPIACEMHENSAIWIVLDNQAIAEISKQFEQASIIRPNKVKIFLIKAAMMINKYTLHKIQSKYYAHPS